MGPGDVINSIIRTAAESGVVLGPRLLLAKRLEFRRYVDPRTGRSPWLDFQNGR